MDIEFVLPDAFQSLTHIFSLISEGLGLHDRNRPNQNKPSHRYMAIEIPKRADREQIVSDICDAVRGAINSRLLHGHTTGDVILTMDANEILVLPSGFIIIISTALPVTIRAMCDFHVRISNIVTSEYLRYSFKYNRTPLRPVESQYL